MITHYCNQYGIELQFINDGTEAYFSPSDKVIRIPDMSNFSSIYEYVSCVAHEAIHSTMIINNRVSVPLLANDATHCTDICVYAVGVLCQPQLERWCDISCLHLWCKHTTISAFECNTGYFGQLLYSATLDYYGVDGGSGCVRLPYPPA